MVIKSQQQVRLVSLMLEGQMMVYETEVRHLGRGINLSKLETSISY